MIKTLILGVILTVLLYPAKSFTQNDMDEYNMSFQLYTNNMYASGEDVSINIYAYYLKKGAQFEFTIYKIKDMKSFLRQHQITRLMY
jgi:hypothetical protein